MVKPVLNVSSIKTSALIPSCFSFQPKGSGEPEGRGSEAAAAAGTGKERGAH